MGTSGGRYVHQLLEIRPILRDTVNRNMYKWMNHLHDFFIPIRRTFEHLFKLSSDRNIHLPVSACFSCFMFHVSFLTGSMLAQLLSFPHWARTVWKLFSLYKSLYCYLMLTIVWWSETFKRQRCRKKHLGVKGFFLTAERSVCQQWAADIWRSGVFTENNDGWRW